MTSKELDRSKGGRLGMEWGITQRKGDSRVKCTAGMEQDDQEGKDGW